MAASNNSKEIIFFDIDDTIADFSGAMNDVLIDYAHYIHRDQELSQEEYINIIKSLPDEEYCFLIESANVLPKLELIPNSFDYLKHCYDNYKLFFISARNWHSNAESMTQKWLEEKNIKFDGLIITGLNEFKSDYMSKFKNVRLFVDDKYEQYKKAKEDGIKSLLRNHPNNILRPCKQSDRIDDLNKLINI